jgi:flagellar assembly protein FliH
MSNLTAWERWELAAFDEVSRPAAAPVKDEPPAVKPPTEEEVEQIREQARQEGYQAGWASGRTEVMQAATHLGSAAARLDEAFAGLETQVADEMLALAVEIARQVVRGELVIRPERLLDVVREALAQLPQQHASIFLHPEDASMVRSFIGDQLGHAGHRIHEDAQLKRGDCVIEAGGSHLDASVATRWHRTVEGLGLESAWDDPAAKP